MDYQKIGSFIKKLREENNLTQDKLADLIPIGRTAISKWENGNTIPDPSVLIKLSEIFNIPINDILLGKRINGSKLHSSNTIVFELYKKFFNERKIIRRLLYIICLLLLFFLSYYFIVSYKSTRVYSISGFGNNYEISNGIMVLTNKKHYFYIGRIESKNNKTIKKIELYLKKDDEEMILIDSQDNEQLFLIDYNGYNEFYLSNFIENNYKTFLKVYDNESSEIIELKFVRDYINDYIILKMNDEVVVNHNPNNSLKNVLYSENTTFINKLNNSLIFEGNTGFLQKKHKNGQINIIYNKTNNVIDILYEENGIAKETWDYNINLKNLGYTSDSESYLIVSSNVQCIIGKCDDWKEKNNEFWMILNEILN